VVGGNHINAAETLFTPQFTDPTIQIHRNGANHWLTSTYKKGAMQLFDSKWHDDVSRHKLLKVGSTNQISELCHMSTVKPNCIMH